MSNDVIINVKVKNDTNFDPVEKSVRNLSTAASSAGNALTSAFGNAAQSAGQLGSSMLTGAASTAAIGTASTVATGGMNLLSGALLATLGAIPAVIGGFAALAPALLAAGGAAGAAITGITGLGIALATLKIGFGGIGAALTAHGKSMGGAGKTATDTAEQEYQAAKRIKDASRAVVDAQKNVVQAQKAVLEAKEDERDAAEDVNRARREEVDRIRELDLALRGQKISQAEAAQALIEAKEKARRAEIAGSAWEKAEARNAVARAQLQYDEVGEKLGDLTEEKKKADKVGVEGSDKVQNALDRQKDAHERVISAQERVVAAQEGVKRAQEALADAHHKVATASTAAGGGINAFNDAMNKLSPNAQKLVYALLAIEKRFEAIKRRVQDRLLAGFDVAVTELADKWLPHLDDILGNMADHLNKFGKTLMTALGDSTFIKNIERAGEEFGKFIDKIGHASEKVIDAFGRIAGHSGPVLQKIGELIDRIATKFDNWIKKADETGKLDSFMKAAADTLQDIFDIAGLVFEIIGKVIAILFPGSQAAGDSVFDKVKASLEKVSDWLNDKGNQEKITQFIDDVQGFLTWLVEVGIPAAVEFGREIEKWSGYMDDAFYSILDVWDAMSKGADIVFNWIVKKVKGVFDWIIKTSNSVDRSLSNMWNGMRNGANSALNWVSTKVSSVWNWLRNAANNVGKSLSGMWEGMKNGFRNAVNWIIWKWNNLSFTIGGGSFLGAAIPSARFDTPDIPYLARGGIAGGLAMVGEKGRELVRLPQGSTVIPNGQTESMVGQSVGNGGALTIGFEPGSGNKLETVIIEAIQNYVKTRGGNAQVALGRKGVA